MHEKHNKADPAQKVVEPASLNNGTLPYRAVFENSHTVMLLIDPNSSKIVDANPTACAFYGYEHQILTTMCLTELNTLSRQEIFAAMEEVRGARRREFIFQHRMADGTVRDVEIHSSPVKIGNKTLLFSIIHDITKRGRAQEALRESQQLYSAVVKQASDGIYLLNPVTKKILEANRSLCRMLGYTRDEFSALQPYDFVSHDRQEVDKIIQEISRKGEGVVGERIYRHKDGHLLDVEVSANSISYAGKQMLCVVVRDITRRKKAEKALKKSRQLFDWFMKHLPSLAFMKNSKGRYLFYNDACKTIFGQLPEERVGKTDEELWPAEVARALRENDRQVMSTGKSLSTVETVPVGDRKQYHLVTKFPIFKDGKPFILAGFAVDITARIEAEKESERLKLQLLQAQKMEAIGTLAGGIAHDFNNLLMGILGRTSILLMDTGPRDPRHEHLKDIEQHVKSAADLTRQLLGFARGGKYDVRPIDINALLREQNTMFARTHKEICFHENFGDDLRVVEADRGQLKQVMLNLYVNAWQAMPDGGHLFIKTENKILDRPLTNSCGAPGAYVKISVTDTGIGMDKATCQRIFEPFFTTREMGHGTGLGLASVYGIIQNHGGIIQVTSRKGEGATFDIFLPASEKPAQSHQPRLMETMLRGSETVLLIDDEPMVAEVGAKMMGRLGYQVLTAGSGPEALAIYSQKYDDIDVVVLDMIMPEMNGEQTFRRLEKINENIKVIFSSGYSLNHQAMGETSCSNHPFIQKPFDIAKLSHKLRKVLDS